MAWVNVPNLTSYDASLGAGDWQYDETTKKLQHAAGTHRTTVNALYSALMDLADNADFMDADVPMKANTPTEYELIGGWTMNAASDYGYLKGGSIKDVAGNDLWANFYNLGTLKAGTVIYIEQNGALVTSPPGYTDGDMDVLVKVVSSGTAVDSREVSFFARNLGDTYDVFTIAAPATGGRNPVPISTATDINDDSGTSSDGGVTIAFGDVNQDIGDGTSAPYTVSIDGNGLSTANAYKALKYILRRENNAAIDSPENTTEARFYRLADPAFSELKNCPFGSYAGGKFFGAQGVWFSNVSDPNNRQLLDDNGVTRTPPTSIIATITGVASGDRVLLARTSGGVINKSQFTISSVTSNSIVATVAPGNDIPTSGVIRIDDTPYTYSGITSATFTGVSPDPTGKTGGFYVPLIDAAASGTSIVSPSMIYVSDFDVIVRVRKKGILPFENTGTVTSSGFAASAIRTTDTIVS
jgi:hypothetical protein